MRFGQQARGLYEEGQRIENVDLFVYGQNKYFFVEVKKGKDKLREPQQTSMYLVKKPLDTDIVVVYLKELIVKGEKE